MSYTIMVAVFVDDVNDATEAYNKALSGMNAACAIPGISYETTDEWFDNDGEQLMEDEINTAVQKSIVLEQMAADEDDLLTQVMDEVEVHEPSGMSLTKEQKDNGWTIVQRGGMWMKVHGLD